MNPGGSGSVPCIFCISSAAAASALLRASFMAAAINDARAKADAAAAEEMQKMQSTLPLPPGFKLPF